VTQLTIRAHTPEQKCEQSMELDKPLDIPLCLSKIAANCLGEERRAEICGTAPTVSLILSCVTRLRPTIGPATFTGKGVGQGESLQGKEEAFKLRAAHRGVW